MIAQRRDRRHPNLFHRPALLLPHDGERGRHDAGDRREVGDETRNQEQRASKLRVVPDPGRHADERRARPPGQPHRRIRQNGIRVAQHRRRRVGVLAVECDLDFGEIAFSKILRESGRYDEHRPRRSQVQQPLHVRVIFNRRHLIEVRRPNEGGDEPPALFRVIAVLDRERDVPDVEVQRVPVQEQEEDRDEQQNQEAPAVAPDLPQFLHRDSRDASHAALPRSRRSTTSRKTSSRDGTTGSRLVTL